MARRYVERETVARPERAPLPGGTPSGSAPGATARVESSTWKWRTSPRTQKTAPSRRAAARRIRFVGPTGAARAAAPPQGGRAALWAGEGDGGGFVGGVLRDEVAAEGADQDATFQVVEEGEGAGGFVFGSARRDDSVVKRSRHDLRGSRGSNWDRDC